MRVIILILLFCLIHVFAKDITPYKYITASHAVSDFVKVGNTLVIGTEEGVIDIYDLAKDEIIDQVIFPKVKDVWGDEIRSLVLSVDYFENKLIFILRLLSGWRELYIYENKTLTKLIEEPRQLTLQKVKFIDSNTVIMGTMSNSLILYDLKNRKITYEKQLNLASFSDLVLSKDKRYVYTADESPIIYKIHIKSGNIVERYHKANKRDIFSIDYKNSLLLSGGKDKRVILYKTPQNYKMTKGDFFIYSVGLNPDATKAAFVKNENDEISVIDTDTLQELYLLKGHKQTILKIDFHKADELITADEDKRLMFWKLE